MIKKKGLRKKKKVIGGRAAAFHPHNGIKRKEEELLLEMEERDFENLPGLAHGLKPIGQRWSGKYVTAEKRSKL